MKAHSPKYCDSQKPRQARRYSTRTPEAILPRPFRTNRKPRIAVHSPVVSIMDETYGNKIGSRCLHCRLLLSLAGNVLDQVKPDGTRNHNYRKVASGVPLVDER